MSVILEGSKFFTKNKLNQLMQDASRLQTVVTEAKTNRERLEIVYQELVKHYRNEYVYKNTLFNKLVLGKHSLNTTSALVELPIGDSIADFILFNGKAVVYEIKTELDSLERLANQLENYYKAFDTVNVVIAEQHYNAVAAALEDSPVGIIVLTSRMTLSQKKDPITYQTELNPYIWFSILRKYEFETILQSHFGYLPNTNDFEYYDACRDLFLTIDKDELYKSFVLQLKKRNFQKNTCIDYRTVPEALRSLVYFSNFKEQDYLQLTHFLEQ